MIILEQKKTTHTRNRKQTNQTYAKVRRKGYDKHAGVEGQAKKTASICQTVLFTLPTWLELLMF